MSLLLNGLSSLASEVTSVFDFTATPTNDQTTVTKTASSTSAKATVTGTSTASSTSKTTASTATFTSSQSSSKATSFSLSSTTSSEPTSSTSTSLSSSSSKSSSFSSITTTTSTLANPIASPNSTSTPSSSSDGNHVSTVGIAVAAVFAVLIIAGVAYLLWKYLPVAQRYRERKYHERSHRKGFSLDDEAGMHFDDPQQGLGLRKFSFHTAPTYYPGQPHEPEDISKRPLTSASDDHVVSPISTRSMESHSQHALPSAFQPGITSYVPYREVRASQIGVAVPLRINTHDKGLPSLPSLGYGRPFP